MQLDARLTTQRGRVDVFYASPGYARAGRSPVVLDVFRGKIDQQRTKNFRLLP